MFDRERFIQFMLDNGVVGFFESPVTLKSGRTSNWYVNWRAISGDAFLTDRLAGFLIDFTRERGWEPDSFYGVPEGASKLGVVATMKWAASRDDFAPGRYPLPMGRGKPKAHGDPADRLYLTPPRGRVVVVEDVTTTGGSLLAALEALKDLEEVEVIAAVGLTSRMERRDDGSTVAEAVRAMGHEYYALSAAEDFLPPAFRRLAPGEKIGHAIEEEFARNGERALRLIGN